MYVTRSACTRTHKHAHAHAHTHTGTQARTHAQPHTNTQPAMAQSLRLKDSPALRNRQSDAYALSDSHSWQTMAHDGSGPALLSSARTLLSSSGESIATGFALKMTSVKVRRRASASRGRLMTRAGPNVLFTRKYSSAGYACRPRPGLGPFRFSWQRKASMPKLSFCVQPRAPIRPN